MQLHFTQEFFIKEVIFPCYTITTRVTKVLYIPELFSIWWCN